MANEAIHQGVEKKETQVYTGARKQTDLPIRRHSLSINCVKASTMKFTNLLLLFEYAQSIPFPTQSHHGLSLVFLTGAHSLLSPPLGHGELKRKVAVPILSFYIRKNNSLIRPPQAPACQ